MSLNIVVWMDHESAKVLHVGADFFERAELHVAHHLHRPHKHGAAAEDRRDAAEEHPFFDDVARHLADATSVLVVGPAHTKDAFVTYVQSHHKDLARKIVAVEPADLVTDGQLVAHARKHFDAAQRMRG